MLTGKGKGAMLCSVINTSLIAAQIEGLELVEVKCQDCAGGYHHRTSPFWL